MRKVFSTFLAGCMFLMVFGFQAFAVNPGEVLENPELEARARALSVEIRCLVCQNQSIDDSDAQLARDLRVLVREQLVEGKTDEEVLDFLVVRYGEFVLLKPQFSTKNLALWILPLIALLGGIWFVRSLFSKREALAELNPTQPLSETEKEEISRLIEK